MGIRAIKNIEILCDRCKKVVATGQSSAQLCQKAEEEARYTELYCTDCRKPPLDNEREAQLTPEAPKADTDPK